jgi:cobalt-zinc-cadmium efflux system protein
MSTAQGPGDASSKKEMNEPANENRKGHASHHHRTGTKLLVSILLNAAITGAELVAGVVSHSLALVSDALHNFSDVFALLLSYVGERMEERPSTFRMTYGYRRAETLIALLNAVTLVGVAIYIFMEAWERFRHPQAVSWGYVASVGAFAFVGNIASVALLHGEKDHNLNVKAAFLHLLYDALSSLGVIGSALVIWLTSWYPIDVVVSLLIGCMIIGGSWGLFKGIYMVLMEAAPRGMSTPDIIHFMRSFKGVADVHHVHVWSLSSNLPALSAHVVLHEEYLGDMDQVLHEITQGLKLRYELSHITLQPELRRCADPAPSHEQGH